jgi:hypothetical protein
MTPLKFTTLFAVFMFAVVKGISVPIKDRQLSDPDGKQS